MTEPFPTKCRFCHEEIPLGMRVEIRNRGEKIELSHIYDCLAAKLDFRVIEIRSKESQHGTA